MSQKQDLTKKIDDYKDILKRIATEKNSLSVEEQVLIREKQTLDEKAKEYNVTLNTLDAVVLELQEELTRLIAECDSLDTSQFNS